MQTSFRTAQTYLTAKLAYFCYFAAMAGFMPFLMLYYAQLGLTASQIGQLIGITPVVTFIAAPLWGALADTTRQHKRLLLLAIGAALGIVAIFLSASTFYQLLPIIIAFGLFTAPIMPLIDNSVLELLGERRSQYGRLRLWGAVGWGVIGALSGVLVDHFGLRTSFFSYFVLMGALMITVGALPVSHSSIGRRFWQGAASLFADWQWTILLITVFSSSVAMSVTHGFLFLYIDDLGASKTLMGLSLAVATLSEIPIFFYADRLLRRWGARGVLLMALAAQIIRVLAYAAMPAAWWVLPINLLHGLTFSAMWSASVACAQELAAPKGMVATAQGLLAGITMGLGGIVGALLGGVIFDQWGPVTLFNLAGLCTLLGLIFFGVIGRGISRKPVAVKV